MSVYYFSHTFILKPRTHDIKRAIAWLKSPSMWCQCEKLISFSLSIKSMEPRSIALCMPLVDLAYETELGCETEWEDIGVWTQAITVSREEHNNLNAALEDLIGLGVKARWRKLPYDCFIDDILGRMYMLDKMRKNLGWGHGGIFLKDMKRELGLPDHELENEV